MRLRPWIAEFLDAILNAPAEIDLQTPATSPNAPPVAPPPPAEEDPAVLAGAAPVAATTPLA